MALTLHLRVKDNTRTVEQQLLCRSSSPLAQLTHMHSVGLAESPKDLQVYESEKQALFPSSLDWFYRRGCINGWNFLGNHRFSVGKA
ncbi:hypothetical protein SLA2020_350120 [Shorea laevis]